MEEFGTTREQIAMAVKSRQYGSLIKGPVAQPLRWRICKDRMICDL
jgi:hypothetical protein